VKSRGKDSANIWPRQCKAKSHSKEPFTGITGRWLSIFGVSLGALLIRFLVPTPVGQADNRDGPRLSACPER
jgi:hypothetical protein